ncbi:hypothetical protein V8G54_036428 [Vigna mungo]|uniref:F-box domain-containing protein n=1 Tax=Vigna mungo TaxID=3915 RepID=A0AAQ3MIE6_VIGMU
MAAISSAEILPNEVIAEILSWLPAKTLIRFRCVSKTWNSLIINSYFVKLHHKRSILFQMDLRNEAKAYGIMGEKHLYRALKNSYRQRYGVSMKEAERACECFRVAEDESYAAAMKEAAMKEAAGRDRKRDAENAPTLLCCLLLLYGLGCLFGYRR